MTTLFGLALARWQAGATLPEGLTMLASDGTSIAAVVVGEPMHLLASKPSPL